MLVEITTQPVDTTVDEPDAAAFTCVAEEAVDDNWDSVAGLLNAEGAAWTDVKTGEVWQNVGSVAEVAGAAKFGGKGMRTAGSTDRLQSDTLGVWDITQSEWTYEGWHRYTTGGRHNPIVSFGDIFADTNRWQLRFDSSDGGLNLYTQSGSTTVDNVQATTPLAIDDWHYIFMVATGGRLKIYANDMVTPEIDVALTDYSYTTSKRVTLNCARLSTTQFGAIGDFDDVRFTNLARTPAVPTTAHPTQGPVDDDWASVTSLLTGNTDKTDLVEGVTWTTTGTVTAGGTTSRWGRGSLDFGNQAGYLTSTDMEMPDMTGEFTVEGAVYATDLSASPMSIIACDTGAASVVAGFWLYYSTNVLYLRAYSAGSTERVAIDHSVPFTGGVWHDIAISRDSGGTWTLVLDGVANTDTETGTPGTPTTVRYGRWGTTDIRRWKGEMEEWRWTKGVARTSISSAPTAPFPKEGPPDEAWGSVVCYLPFDVDLTDARGNTTFTNAGSTLTTTAKFGSARQMLSESNQGFVSDAAASFWNFLHNGVADWTVDVWVRRVVGGDSTDMRIISGGSSSAGYSFELIVKQDGSVRAVQHDGSAPAAADATTATGVVAAATWSFIRVTFTQSTGVLAVAVDGVTEATDTGSGWASNDASNTLRVGGIPGNTGFDFRGQMDELRITDGVARDLSELPTKPFPTRGTTPVEYQWQEKTAAEASWTPADTTTALWIDASDETTITDTAGAISQVDDKSGNSRHFGIRGNPQTGVDTVNALNVISCTNDALVSNDTASTWSFLHDGTECQVYAVMAVAPNNSNPNDLLTMVATCDSSTANVGFALYYDDRSGSGFNNGTFAGVAGASSGNWVAQVDARSTSVMSRGTLLSSVLLDVDDALDAAKMRFKLSGSGITATSVSSSTASSSASAPTGTLVLGGLATNTTFNIDDGYICEVIIVEGAYDKDRDEKIEGYLSHKWGIESDLPSTHPYVTTAPVSGGFLDMASETSTDLVIDPTDSASDDGREFRCKVSDPALTFLLRDDDTNGNTNITDASDYYRTITVAGSAASTTAEFKWGPTSIDAQAAGDHIELVNSVDLIDMSEPWTVDGWWRFNDGTTDKAFWGTRDSSASNKGIQVWQDSSERLRIDAVTEGGTTVLTHTGTSSELLSGTWQFMRWTYDGNGRIRAAQDGDIICDITAVDTISNGGDTFYIGEMTSAETTLGDQRFEDVMITRGVELDLTDVPLARRTEP